MCKAFTLPEMDVEGIFSHKLKRDSRTSCCQCVTSVTSGLTRVAGYGACDVLSLVPALCHVSDLALGLSQPAGMACVGDRTGPGVRVLPTAVYLLSSCAVIQLLKQLLRRCRPLLSPLRQSRAHVYPATSSVSEVVAQAPTSSMLWRQSSSSEAGWLAAKLLHAAR